jgi:hypothetical protein
MLDISVSAVRASGRALDRHRAMIVVQREDGLGCPILMSSSHQNFTAEASRRSPES